MASLLGDLAFHEVAPYCGHHLDKGSIALADERGEDTPPPPI